MSVGESPDRAGDRGGLRKAARAGAATLGIAPLLLGTLGPVACAPESPATSWPMHVVDSSSEGADGVKLLDANGDGLLDASAPWEIGGEVRLYLNPGPEAAKAPWPRVSVGSVTGPEDAVLADLDGDGFVDAVSATEGSDAPGGKGVFVHWAPASRAAYTDAGQWRTAVVPAARKGQWIQAAVFQVDGRHGPDIAVGSLGEPARVVVLAAPEDPRALDRWQMREIHRGGRKVMALEPHDFDGDGDRDLLLSLAVRDPEEQGLGWLENPGPRQAGAWTLHPIGGPGRSVAFAALGDVDGDGLADVVAPGGGKLFWYRRPAADGPWQAHEIAMPPYGGAAKAVAVADVDGDGRNDVVLTRTWNPPEVLLAKLLGRERWGVAWLEPGATPEDPAWRAHDVSGPVGVKFDRVAMLDLDADGDPDALTTEERVDGGGLGVIWYENPGPGPGLTPAPAASR